LKVVISHLSMLGGNPLDFLRPFKDRENVYFDIALTSQNTLLRFIWKIRPERILFGSDILYETTKEELNKIMSLLIRNNEKEMVLSHNIKGPIGLEATSFSM